MRPAHGGTVAPPNESGSDVGCGDDSGVVEQVIAPCASTESTPLPTAECAVRVAGGAAVDESTGSEQSAVVLGSQEGSEEWEEWG